MGIDGIGRPGAPSAIGLVEPSGVGQAGEASGDGFSLGKVEQVGEASSTDPLAALEQGQISVDQYLDQRVDQAVSHLAGRVDSDQLVFIKESLRAELQADPLLATLVRKATGAI